MVCKPDVLATLVPHLHNRDVTTGISAGGHHGPAEPPPVLLRRVQVLDFVAGGFGPETSLLIHEGRIQWIGAERGRQQTIWRVIKGGFVFDPEELRPERN